MMRVLVGPRTDVQSDAQVAGIARALAGGEGMVVPLRETGVKNLSRRLSEAEVVLLREALGGRPPEAGSLVGYVCRGVALLAGRMPLVAVSDHVGLTWSSPLTGPNDDASGPRFPSMTGIYAPEIVVDRLAGEGMIVVSAVVAGVGDDVRPSAFEREMFELEGYPVASSELVPVAIVAAHMGWRVAALVVVTGATEKGDG